MSDNSLKASLRYYLVVTLVAFLPYVGLPAILHATTGTETTHFFTAPETLSRGNIKPMSQDAQVIARADYCEWLTKDWGWEHCDGIDKYIINALPGVDSLLIEKPNEDGYISLKEWQDESEDAIKEITNALVESTRSQSKRTNTDIRFVGWRAYPEVVQDRKVLFYATELEWAGEKVINIKASIFDRRGYVTLMIVPMDATLSTAEIKDIVLRIAESYVPHQNESYASFTSGDKVAAAGAVGVLAAMIGVKYSKGLLAAIFAFAVMFLKKAWFLLVIPFVAIKRLFQKKASASSTEVTPPAPHVEDEDSPAASDKVADSDPRDESRTT